MTRSGGGGGDGIELSSGHGLQESWARLRQRPWFFAGCLTPSRPCNDAILDAGVLLWLPCVGGPGAARAARASRNAAIMVEDRYLATRGAAMANQTARPIRATATR
jgi:hypothetical protein